jgi:hypothetical protein
MINNFQVTPAKTAKYAFGCKSSALGKNICASDAKVLLAKVVI